MSTAPAAARTEWRVGDAASFEVCITQELIDRFADLSGDRNPLHVDPEYARDTACGGCIAHGMIAGALFSRLVGEHIPGTQALYRGQELRFLAPFRAGDAVVVRGEIAAIDHALSVMKIATTLRAKDRGTLLVEGTAEVVIRPPNPPAAAQKASVSAAPAAVLAGRTMLVVGGSRGIGGAIARELARRGAHLIVGYHTDAVAAESVCALARSAGARAVALRLELDAPAALGEAIAACAASFGAIDTLVHCGFGAIPSHGIDRAAFEELLDAFRRQAGGFFHAVKAVLPSMRSLGRGVIVAVSSSVTLEPPPPNWLAYTTAKSALRGLARSLAVELGPEGIRVNLVSPSLTETERTRALPPRIREEIALRAPLGRLATPEDVAGAVAFLVSDDAAFLTGLDLPIVGGATL